VPAQLHDVIADAIVKVARRAKAVSAPA